jgi:hypothetical protein
MMGYLEQFAQRSDRPRRYHVKPAVNALGLRAHYRCRKPERFAAPVEKLGPEAARLHQRDRAFD